MFNSAARQESADRHRVAADRAHRTPSSRPSTVTPASRDGSTAGTGVRSVEMLKRAKRTAREDPAALPTYTEVVEGNSHRTGEM